MLGNIFEKTGKYLINKNSLIKFLFLLSLPFLLITINSYFKYQKLSQNIEKCFHLESLAKTSFFKRKKIHDFLEKKTKHNNNIIAKIENLPILENEQISIKKIIQNFSFLNSSSLEERLNFLEKENHFKFIEENIKQSINIHEVDETQLYPIEINKNDLKNILSFIEEVKIDGFEHNENLPQLIITNFQLNKIKEDLFTLELKLLKREFIKNHE